MRDAGGRQFHGPRDYLDLAESPHAAPEELRWRARSPYSFVLEAVARHTSTPADVLEQLLTSDAGGEGVMLGLAAHPAASTHLLAAIAERVPPLLHERDSQGFGVGIALFSNPNASDDALLRLVDDPQVTTQFRKVAARKTNRPAVLERLRQDRSETVRRAAARDKG